MAFKEEGGYNKIMAITTVYTGDTIRIKGTFKNSSNVLTDADANLVTFTSITMTLKSRWQQATLQGNLLVFTTTTTTASD